MKFRIVPDQDVLDAISLLSPALQSWYSTQVAPILEDDPHPYIGFPLIKEYLAPDGRPFYEYYDGVLPLILQYRVFESDAPDERPGMIWLAAAVREDGA